MHSLYSAQPGDYASASHFQWFCKLRVIRNTSSTMTKSLMLDTFWHTTHSAFGDFGFWRNELMIIYNRQTNLIYNRHKQIFCARICMFTTLRSVFFFVFFFGGGHTYCKKHNELSTHVQAHTYTHAHTHACTHTHTHTHTREREDKWEGKVTRYNERSVLRIDWKEWLIDISIYMYNKRSVSWE